MQSPVPALTHSLTALSKILDKAEVHATARNIKPEVMPQLRLVADMLPLWRQITIACDHAKGAAARLGGVENPVFPDTETTLPELQDRIARTIAFIATVPDAAFVGAEDRTITFKAGPREMNMIGARYLATYSLPNFFFHMTTAYNIQRGNGVELGKMDFLGA